MKKIYVLITLIIVLFLSFSTETKAVNLVTFFDGRAIKINDPNNSIEVVSNELIINTTTSSVDNDIILKNNSNNEAKSIIIIPLDNEELSTSIHSLSIMVNGSEIECAKNKHGEYVLETIFSPYSSKKIEISYFTDNDLRDARVIKYNLENFGKKRIGKLKVDIILDEKDIPLVQAIYPGHYKYKDNVVTVEYYDMSVNSITKDIIMEKETYKNLMYGREYELNEYEVQLLKDIDTLFKDGFQIDYEVRPYVSLKNQYFKVPIKKRYYGQNNEYSHYEFEYYIELSKMCEQIISYIENKQYVKDEKFERININNLGILGQQTFVEYMLNLPNYENNNKALTNKIICVEFVETVDSDELYIYKNVTGDECYGRDELVPVTEREVLKTEVEGLRTESNFGEKVVFIDEDINGEKLNATDEEKMEYINSINADFYIRVELYEGKVITWKEVQGTDAESDVSDGRVGYYRDSDINIAKAFINNKAMYNNYNEEKIFIKLNNEYIANNCEVPTLVQFIGYVREEDGKDVVGYFDFTGFYDGYERGITTTANVLETAEAQSLLNLNKEKNETKKLAVLDKIKNVQYIDNEIEIQEKLKLQKQQEEKEEQEKNEQNIFIQNNIEEVQNSINTSENSLDKMNINIKDILVFTFIGIGVIICILILIFEKRKGVAK